MTLLQRLAEKAADQAHHLVIVAEMLRFVQRHIVFINQKNCLLPIMLMEELAKGQKAGGKRSIGHAEPLFIRGINCNQLLIRCFFPGSKRFAVQQELKAHGFPPDD